MMAHPVRIRRRSGGKLLRRTTVAACGIVAASVGLAAVAFCSSPVRQQVASRAGPSRSDLLRTSIPVVLTSGGIAVQPASAEVITVIRPEPGKEYPLMWNGDPNDFIIGKIGDGLQTRTGKEYISRLVYVKPGGYAMAQGAKIGDELVYLFFKGEQQAYGVEQKGITEVSLRAAEDEDAEVKRKIAGTEGTAYLVLKARAVVQPGEEAPKFELPCVFPAVGNESQGKIGQCSMNQAIGNGKSAVLFFRPGIRFSGGDTMELKMLRKLKPTFEALGINFATVSSDRSFKAQRQGKAYGVNYPMVVDEEARIANEYGAVVNLDNIGAATDRMTFIVGPDGLVQRVYAGVGWTVTKQRMAGHLADVVKAVGGDRDKAYETAMPKEMTVGDAINIAKKAAGLNAEKKIDEAIEEVPAEEITKLKKSMAAAKNVEVAA